MKKKSLIPGPGQHNAAEAIDGQAMLPKRLGEFRRGERRTIAGEIFHKHLKKETSVPGIGHYDPTNMAWRADSRVTKIKGSYRNVDKPPGWI